jgi:uncharacterized protein (DUF4213/DUF364 family)
MTIYQDLLNSLPDGGIVDVRIGLHWTAVTVEIGGQRRCGLSSTLAVPHGHKGKPDVPQAGSLTLMPGKDLARLVLEQDHPTLASVGMATINALLKPPSPDSFSEGNAEHILAAHGGGRKVVIVGHFPFVPRLKEKVGELVVLDQLPREDDLPAEEAPKVVPEADVVAITGMTLVNHTLVNLLQLCSPDSLVVLLGPSTPLSPVLFEYGVDMLCGSLVANINSVLDAVSQGANFRQVHRAGVRLVNLVKPGLKLHF